MNFYEEIVHWTQRLAERGYDAFTYDAVKAWAGVNRDCLKPDDRERSFGFGLIYDAMVWTDPTKIHDPEFGKKLRDIVDDVIAADTYTSDNLLGTRRTLSEAGFNVMPPLT